MPFNNCQQYIMDVYLATFCLFLSLATLVTAAPIEDEITALPGLNKQPYWKQYSGFLNATGTKRLHYWFLESANNPQTDPLVLWMNGGPGCSSDLGLLSEHGPFVISSDGTTVTYNNYSWNKVANMLYLEAPAGVGFSYAYDKNYTTDDDLTSLDNYAALKNFFIKFPEFVSNDFYITGESYGGIYVPTLSSRVLDDPAINFKGFVVGNGLSDDELNDDSLLYFGYYHGLLGESLWNQMIQTCCAGNSTRCTFYRNSLNNTSCQQQLSKAFSFISYSGLNEYNLYAECKGQPSQGFFFNQKTQMFYHSLFGWKFTKEPTMHKKMKALKELMKVTKVGLTPPCLNYDNIIKYMNSSEVRQALHIPDSVQAWDVCSTLVNFHYKRVYDSMMDQYLKTLAAEKRILVYNGDVDMACNFLGDEWFTDSLNQPLVADRKTWFYTAADGSKQVAGFVTQFEGLTVVTVKGAGHMVPADKPVPALEMITNFLRQIPF